MSECGELIEWCRTRAQQANLAYEMHGQRPHEFHGQYAVDVAQLCDALEEAERENEKLYDLAVQNGVRAREAEGKLRELLSYLESAGAYDETWTSTKEVVAERVIDAARTFRAEVLADPAPTAQEAEEGNT